MPFRPILIFALAGFAACCLAAEEERPLSLPPADAPRFELTGRAWPAEVGEPHVCLWKDDALAAVSITIDDNTAPDHDWWIEQGRKHGVRATWFVITSLVSDERPGYHGSWEDFRRLEREGHDVQSHTITHVSPGRGFDPDDPEHDLHVEYGQSRQIIERNVPGVRVTTLAFPGGSYQRDHTDPALAARYYIAARGTVGQINAANRVDYRQTSSVGNGLHVDDPRHARTCLVNLVDPEKAYRPFQYRGWYVTHFHRVAEADKPRLEAAFAWLRQNRADVWTGLFREVARYGQERDTAKLRVESAGDEEIRLALVDGMDDDRFDFPLTIKVRLPDQWKACSAMQAGRDARVQIVEREGARFALVEAVPDRGELALRPAPASSTLQQGARR